jgi:hypothetical protein
LAVRDPAIATQELLKWHEKYAAGDPAIVSRELAKQQEKYTIQDPGTVKWQETYARPETAKLENGKEETKETVKLIARGKKTEETNRQYLILVIKNSQTCTITM